MTKREMALELTAALYNIHPADVEQIVDERNRCDAYHTYLGYMKRRKVHLQHTYQTKLATKGGSNG